MADEVQGDLEIQVNDRLLKRGLRFTACAWRTGCASVRGLKTFISCGALGLLGLYDEIGGGDLIQTLKDNFGQDAKLGGWIIGTALFFTILRIVTKAENRGGKPNDEGDTINH